MESDQKSQQRLAYERMQKRLDEANRNTKKNKDEKDTKSDSSSDSSNNACQLEPRSDKLPFKIAPRRPYTNGGGFSPNVHTMPPRQEGG